MKPVLFRAIACIGVLGLLANGAWCPADENGGEQTAAPSTADGIPGVALQQVEMPPLPKEVEDPDFDKHVDIRLIGEAWAALDASRMLVVATQLAKGEAALGRPHKGISSDQAFSLAMKRAIENRDRGTYGKLEKALEDVGKKDLLIQLRAARKAMESTRQPALMFSADELSENEFASLKSTLGLIRKAKVAGDRESLGTIAKILDERDEELSPDVQKALIHQVKTALSELEVQGSDTDIPAALLEKLEAVTRDPFVPVTGTTPEVWHDWGTGRLWTVTLTATPSSHAGRAQALQIVNSISAAGGGWRLPTFSELQQLNPPGGGFGPLRIRTYLLSYYWTADERWLGNAYGNGFQTPQRWIPGIGNIWVIATKP